MKLRTAAVLGVLGTMAGIGTSLAAADGTKLEMPAGVPVALVVFEDLQCPDCRRAHPQLTAAAQSAGVPLVIHDFPIKRHAWAFPAAVLARWFGAQSPELEARFRSYVFQNQPGVGADNIRSLAERFAATQGIVLPDEVDPDGRLAAGVQADYALGVRIGLEYVPLIFVLGRADDATLAVEVTDTAQLSGVISGMKDSVAASAAPQADDAELR